MTSRGALALGRRAGAIGASVRVDALVELGRYDEAERELQAMIDRKPNLAAYARASYLRELRGDLDGAARRCASPSPPAARRPENRAYVRALLGELERRRGKHAAAQRAFGRRSRWCPASRRAEAGPRARLERRPTAAIGRLRGSSSGCRCPEYVIALGEAELAAGRTAAGRETLALVAAEQQLQRAAGVDVDVELAVFEADHGSPRARGRARAARLGRGAERALRRRARLGADPQRRRRRQGCRWARRALRLGSVDPLWRAHAGLSALAAGRVEEGRRHLRIALAHGLDGFPWQAQRVRRALR